MALLEQFAGYRVCHTEYNNNMFDKSELLLRVTPKFRVETTGIIC